MPKLGAPGGDDQIAGERDLHAAGDREALDRGDQRLERCALGDAGEAAVAEPGRLALDERAQVHARAEEAAGAGEHADRQGVVAVELVQRARDALGDGGVDGVANLGTVDRDQQDVPAPLGEYRLLAVGYSPQEVSACRSRSSLAVRRPVPALKRRTGQLGLALAAQHLDVHLDAVDPARGRQHARLGLDHLATSTPRQEAMRGVEADALQVAGELLDGTRSWRCA